MNFLPALTALLICQLAGTAVQQAFALPVPGAVIGMVMLFAGLVVRKKISHEMDTTARTLLHTMPLLFVPAGVGVIQQFDLIEHEWLPITASLVLSCIATIAFTGVVMQLGLKWSGTKTDKDG
jgi:holin-like protein